MEDKNTPEVVVTVSDPVITERGTFENFTAEAYTEKTDCMAFEDTDISAGVIRVQLDNIRSVVYL